jgi:hypothetical protein
VRPSRRSGGATAAPEANASAAILLSSRTMGCPREPSHEGLLSFVTNALRPTEDWYEAPIRNRWSASPWRRMSAPHRVLASPTYGRSVIGSPA